jgi:hypothetical protein
VPIIFSGVQVRLLESLQRNHLFLKQYNIPVNIYVTEDYPRSAPQIYVRPTASKKVDGLLYAIRFDGHTLSDMVIKPNHRHVDTQGLVYMPYLHSWTPASSTLQELTSALSGVFGQDPPVYSKTSSPPGDVASASSRVVQGTMVSTPTQYSPSGSVTGGYISQQQYHPQRQQPPPQQYRAQQPPAYGASPSYPPTSHPPPSAAPVRGIVDSMHIPDYLKEGQQAQGASQRGSGGGAGSSKERLVREVTARLQEEILI